MAVPGGESVAIDVLLELGDAIVDKERGVADQEPVPSVSFLVVMDLSASQSGTVIDH